MNLRYLLPIAMLFCASSSALTQTLSWHQGSLVLADNYVITGNISVQPAHNLVLFSAEGTVSVFPAHRIKSAYFYDSLANINRKFTAIQQVTQQGRLSQLYEIVIYGPLKVLRRFTPYSSGYNEDSGYTYFIQFEGNLFPLMDFRKEVYPHLLQNPAIPEDILTAGGLKPYRPEDVIRMVVVYNKRLQQTASTSSANLPW